MSKQTLSTVTDLKEAFGAGKSPSPEAFSKLIDRAFIPVELTRSGDYGLEADGDGKLTLKTSPHGGISATQQGVALQLAPQGGLAIDANQKLKLKDDLQITYEDFAYLSVEERAVIWQLLLVEQDAIRLVASPVTKKAEFGYCTSLNAAGDWLAIGANNDASSGKKGGAVYLFTREKSGWVFKQSLQSSAEQPEFFGISVSLNAQGDKLAVGSSNDNGNGSVHIFARTSSSSVWQLEKQILTDSFAAKFGISVSLDAAGEWLAVGANVQSDNGAVYIYQREGTTWSEGRLLQQGEENAELGISVSLNAKGDKLAVGAHKEEKKGAVYLFNRTGTNWVLDQRLTQAQSKYFGVNIRLNAAGDRLAVGATLESDRGAAYLFEHNKTEWQHTQRLQPQGKIKNFGSSISLNAAGDRLAIGATHDDDDGAVYLYSLEKSAWELQKRLPAEQEDSYFGQSVCLNEKGDLLVVGASREEVIPEDGGSALQSAGAAYIMANLR